MLKKAWDFMNREGRYCPSGAKWVFAYLGFLSLFGVGLCTYDYNIRDEDSMDSIDKYELKRRAELKISDEDKTGINPVKLPQPCQMK